jgi:hypothetical protein
MYILAHHSKAVKDYLNENKIIPKEGGINFSKVKILSLSFLSTNIAISQTYGKSNTSIR